MSTPILKKNSRGERVRQLQRKLGVTADGDLGQITWAAWRERFVTLGGWGFSGGRTRARRRWDLVMSPSTQTAREKRRADKLARRYGTGYLAARAFWRRHLGRKESPAGSNRGDWGLTQWQRDFGSWLIGQAWCGVAVGKALIAAGVKGVTSRCASVWLILQDGLAGKGGFRDCVFRRSTGRGSTSAIRAGHVVGIGGESTHVEQVDEIVAGGAWCFGGNTSDRSGGSVSNGGMVARNFRPWSQIVYAVRPRYPEVTA